MGNPLRCHGSGVLVGTRLSKDSMTEITSNGPDRTCDLRLRIRVRFRTAEVRAVAQYRSHIAELSGFARARCPSDAY
jgi:hypothetical protein